MPVSGATAPFAVLRSETCILLRTNFCNCATALVLLSTSIEAPVSIMNMRCSPRHRLTSFGRQTAGFVSPSRARNPCLPEVFGFNFALGRGRVLPATSTANGMSPRTRIACDLLSRKSELEKGRSARVSLARCLSCCNDSYQRKDLSVRRSRAVKAGRTERE